MRLDKPMRFFKEPLRCYWCSTDLTHKGHIMKAQAADRYYCAVDCLINGEQKVVNAAGKVS